MARRMWMKSGNEEKDTGSTSVINSKIKKQLDA